MSEEVKLVEQRQAKQKEITVTSTTGRYAKNEVTIRYLGLASEFPTGGIQQEAKDILDQLEKNNPVKETKS